ncbi:MAG: alcohol dehydrogenase [Chloroflexota bacterium]|nr:alcohol dehydrogenase [Chloroflexota bacterium]
MLGDRIFDLTLRDRVRFGRGTIRDLPALVREVRGPAARAFIVSDPGVVTSGVVATVQRVLAEATIETGLFGAVEPNPGTTVVERGGADLRAFGIQGVVVVPVGGGSSMDTAKAMSLYAANTVRAADLGYDNLALVAGLPVIAVPTTAGTGAETNSFGVITDEAARRKAYIGHPSLLPVACILDPDLTAGLPPAATAATGIDALTHSLESLLSRNPNPFAEALALQVIRTVGAWLPRAVAAGDDMEARGQLLLASHLAGVGQASGTGVGLVHALGHALGTRGRLPHGTALAAVMPGVLAFYLGTRDRELALVAVALGAASSVDEPAAAAHKGVDAVARLIEAVGQRRTLRELGLGVDMIATLAGDALVDPAIDNSPRLPTAAEATAILEAVAG